MSWMNHGPFIGIATYGRNDENRYSLPAEYVDAVRSAGAIPLLLPPGDPCIKELLDLVDGLILSGGGDVDPAHYGGGMHKSVYMLDAERDKSEFDLTGRAIDSGKPVFAICRGIHVINVVLGGTLLEHIPDVVGEKIKHRLPPREPTPHKVLIEPDTRLMSVLGKREICPLSWHHQAIGVLAPGLTVSARAPDDIIEAVEMPGHEWLIGVQWHPELTAAVDADQQRLFDGFISAVGSRGG